MKKEMNFKTIESLDSVKRVIKEAEKGLSQKSRTIETSDIPEVLGAVVGAGIGGAGAFAALYFLGYTGLSAAGITSGLATAGSIVGGGMVAGIGVLAAPVAILGVAGYAYISSEKAKKLKMAKEMLLQEVIKKHNAVIRALREELNASKQRIEYLNSLNTLLQAAIRDLKEDLV